MIHTMFANSYSLKSNGHEFTFILQCRIVVSFWAKPANLCLNCHFFIWLFQFLRIESSSVCVCRHCDMLSHGFLWDPFNFGLKGHHLYGVANSSAGELAFVELCKPFVLWDAMFSDCINLQMGQKDQNVRYNTFIQIL